MDLGNKILEFRRKAGLSQEELAYKLNVSRQSVSLWETNQTQPTLENLMAISSIFDVSLDELCGKESKLDNEYLTPLFTSKTKYSYEMCLNAFKKFSNKNLIVNIIGIIFSIIFLIGCFISEVDKLIIIFMFLVLSFFIGNIIRIKRYSKSSARNSISAKPNLETTFCFFEDNIVIYSVSDNLNSKTIKKYSDIKDIKQDNRYFYIRFNDVFAVIDKETCIEHQDELKRLLKIDKVKINSKIKTILIISFILSLVSLYLGLIIVAISTSLSLIPDVPFLLVEHMYKIYYMMIFPIISIVLGFIYINKGYKCKKNIIAGFIMPFILFIFGSFSFIFEDLINHDDSHLITISNEINMNITGYEYVASIEDYLYEGDLLTMIKYEDSSFYESYIRYNANWSKNVPYTLDIMILSLVQGYEYHYIYDNVYGNDIYLSYDIEENILLIYCFEL